MVRPLRLPNDVVAEHEVLLAKELEHRRNVDQPDAESLRRPRDSFVPGADVGPPGFRVAAELAHRMDSPADTSLRLEHEYVETLRLEQ
jgi:hypothetical protein